MSTVVLDSTPLGLLCHPQSPPTVVACRFWFQALQASGRRIVLPEIIDYEIRREFILTRKTNVIKNLDILASGIEYLPLTTSIMRNAATLWAQVRQSGQPTAASHAIDVDVILAA